MSELRLKIESIKAMLEPQPVMRMALEDVLSKGDCFILLREPEGRVLPVESMVSYPDSYEQVVAGKTIAIFSKEEVLHLCRGD